MTDSHLRQQVSASLSDRPRPALSRVASRARAPLVFAASARRIGCNTPEYTVMANASTVRVGVKDTHALRLYNGEASLCLINPTEQLYAFLVLQSDDLICITPSIGAVAPGENVALAMKFEGTATVDTPIILLSRPITSHQKLQLELEDCDIFEMRAMAPVFASCGRIELLPEAVPASADEPSLLMASIELGSRPTTSFHLQPAPACELRMINPR